MDSRLWSAKVMTAVGFLMLLLTSLQGWGMIGMIAFWSHRAFSLPARTTNTLTIMGYGLQFAKPLDVCVAAQ